MFAECTFAHLCHQSPGTRFAVAQQGLGFHHEDVGITEKGEIVAETVGDTGGVLEFSPAQAVIHVRSVNRRDIDFIHERAVAVAAHYDVSGRVILLSGDIPFGQAAVVGVKGLDKLRYRADATPRTGRESISGLTFGRKGVEMEVKSIPVGNIYFVKRKSKDNFL